MFKNYSPKLKRICIVNIYPDRVVVHTPLMFQEANSYFSVIFSIHVCSRSFDIKKVYMYIHCDSIYASS